MPEIDTYCLALRTAAMQEDVEAFNKVLDKRQEEVDKRLLSLIGEDNESNGGTEEEAPKYDTPGADGSSTA